MPRSRSAGRPIRIPNGTVARPPMRIQTKSPPGKESSFSLATIQPPTAANDSWHSEIIPALPLTTPMPSSATEETTAVMARKTQYGDSTSASSTITTAPVGTHSQAAPRPLTPASTRARAALTSARVTPHLLALRPDQDGQDHAKRDDVAVLADRCRLGQHALAHTKREAADQRPDEAAE